MRHEFAELLESYDPTVDEKIERRLIAKKFYREEIKYRSKDYTLEYDTPKYHDERSYNV